MTTNNNTKKNTTKATSVSPIQRSLHDLLIDAEETKAKRAIKKAKKATGTTQPKTRNSANTRLVNRVEDDIAKTGMSWGYALIPISEILKDMPYQRPTEEHRVKDILKKFTWDKVDCKCVNYRPDEDKFAMMDGLHTLTALETLGFKFIPCKVFVGKSYQEEAAMFAAQNKGIKRITSIEEFNALVEAGDDKAITIMQVLKDYKVELASQTGFKKVRSVRKLTKIMDTIEEVGLRFTFQLIEDADWANDGKAYTEASLNIGWYAFNECLKKNSTLNKTKYKCLIKILQNYKTSTLYVDEANRRYSVTTTKHPEDAVKKLIQADLEIASIQAQKMLDYQVEYRKANQERIVKVK